MLAEAKASEEDYNLLIFGLGARCHRFISVQGGNSAVASWFGGENLVLAKVGIEINENMGGHERAHDYEWYYTFSGAQVWHTNNPDALAEEVRVRYAPEVPENSKWTAVVARCSKAVGLFNKKHSYLKC